MTAVLGLGSQCAHWLGAEGVISGVLRVLKGKGRLFVNVRWAGAGVVSGSG